MFIKELENILKKAISDLGYESDNIKISKSNRPELCDYQCDDVFKLAKEYKQNPIEIGQKIATELSKINNFDDYFKTLEFVKHGFINITLSDILIK